MCAPFDRATSPLSSATAALTAGLEPGWDVLAAGPAAGIAVSYAAGPGASPRNFGSVK